MLAIPAIDIYSGKITRLFKGDFGQTKFYDESPLNYAVKFDLIGSEWLHIVDLAASLNGNISVIDQITEIKSSTNLKIQFGGGVKSLSNARKAFEFGVDRIVIGSISISYKAEFEKIYNEFGANKIVVAADVKDEMIFIKGWTQKSEVTLWNHLEYCISIGIQYFLCTDISKDGTLKGPNIDLYTRIMQKHPQISLIASGGISGLDDLVKLNSSKIYAAVIGKAIYENRISWEELKQFVS
ncbi:MAG: 1-(5-phosphoribosyl)-5-[(5-phosphoribosylamino)methylideneamino] imidazole-4-carboxamide isomerase [Melioribacteraceae bacterium]|nr:1-(5-phosphoribosyl)-5-[(5-phosphoribosylamino)methylideneamino] imidazole-4-carboxamide isomerase [Melioribacteraceae bacterium]